MIESVKCTECVKKIESTAKKELQDIVDHRSKCLKCMGCERLNNVKQAVKELDKE